jgi:hypothetical protein
LALQTFLPFRSHDEVEHRQLQLLWLSASSWQVDALRLPLARPVTNQNSLSPARGRPCILLLLSRDYIPIVFSSAPPPCTMIEHLSVHWQLPPHVSSAFLISDPALFIRALSRIGCLERTSRARHRRSSWPISDFEIVRSLTLQRDVDTWV